MIGIIPLGSLRSRSPPESTPRYFVVDLNNTYYDYQAAHQCKTPVPVYVLRLSKRKPTIFRKSELDGQIAETLRVMHNNHGQDPLCLTITATRILITATHGASNINLGLFGLAAVCDNERTLLSPCHLFKANQAFMYIVLTDSISNSHFKLIPHLLVCKLIYRIKCYQNQMNKMTRSLRKCTSAD